MSLVSAENSKVVAVAENDDCWLVAVDGGIDHRPNQSCAIETGRISIVSTTMNFVDDASPVAAAAVVSSSSV